MTSIHDLPAIEQLRRRYKFDAQRLRRLRNQFYKKHQPVAAAIAELPDEVRGSFTADVEFHALRLKSRRDSRLDGATKLVFATSSGHLIESVILRIATGRTVLCVSSQAGCAANCDFCATGKMDLAHNLSRAEILDQVVQANQLLAAEGRSVRNVVFMGMGEPLHNEEQLYDALDVLSDPGCFGLSLHHVLVSTVGIPEAMVRCARRFPAVRMALSLHSVRQEVRERIMPIARRYGLGELRAAMAEVVAIQGQDVMIEYLLFAELNDTAGDVEALVEYLRDIPVHVNLIPYNPIAEAPHLTGSSRRRRETFSQALKNAGFRVTTRYSLGADIAAACGQLARQEHRRSRSAPVTTPLVAPRP